MASKVISLAGASLTATLVAFALNAAPALAFSPKPPPAIPVGVSHRVPYFKHVFIIMEENHSYADLMYEHDLPYYHYLARHYGLAMQYYGITNPTEGDRIGILSGEMGTKIPSDGYSNVNLPNLIDQLTSHHLTWGAFYHRRFGSTYQDPYYRYQHPKGSSPGNIGNTTLTDFTDIADNPARLQDFHPLRQLTTDLAQNTVPNFVWISPNFVDNMHGYSSGPGAYTFQGAGPGGAGAQDTKVEQYSNSFLAKWVPMIMNSKAWKSGPSVLFIAFDETSYDASMPQNGDWVSNKGVAGSPVVPAGTNLGNSQFPFPGGVDGGGHTLALVITNPPHQVASRTPYNEYSILKTIEKGWNLGYLGNAASPEVRSMSAFFHSQVHYRYPYSSRIRRLAGTVALAAQATPAVSAPAPVSTTSALATIVPGSNPYFTEFTRHQAAATVDIQEKTGAALTGSVTLTLNGPAGVTFAQASSPVGSTDISNPDANAVTFAPSSVTPSTVAIPVSHTGTAPATAIITGLLVNVPYGVPAGPVTAAISSGGQSLGTVVLGTVGAPNTPVAEPQVLAPVVHHGHITVNFVAPPASGHPRYAVQIEGRNPTLAGTDQDEYFEGWSTFNSVTVPDKAAELTGLGGKQYWVRVGVVHGSGVTDWSSPQTFSARIK